MIKKIDADTFEIITETKETVSLFQLEVDLEFIENFNKDVEELFKIYETLPDKIKPYVNLPSPIMRDFEKEELVKTLTYE
jgi:hypothetical protein